MALINKLNISQKIGGKTIIEIFYIITFLIRKFKEELGLLTKYHHKKQLKV